MTGILEDTGAPILLAALAFLVAAAITVVGSIRLAGLGDTLADRTGWGEAFFGAVFFGLVTSMSGIVMTIASGVADQPELAYSNAVGGIAAQTVAIAVADLAYRRANLEHAAASAENLLFGCLLIALLALALIAPNTPDVTLLGAHPVSWLMIAVYLGGLRLVRDHSRDPMWQPVQTDETVEDVVEEDDDASSTGSLWLRFVVVAGVVAVSGWLIADLAGFVVDRTGLGAGFVGTVLMGVVNAIPETVTAIAAVRRRAMTLAVAAILGGNSLDALNLVAGDLAFGGGSIHHVAPSDALFVTGASLLMTAVLLGGLLVRQRRGFGRVGFEGLVLFGVYAGIVVVQVL